MIRKQYPLRISEAMNQELTRIAEYEGLSKNTLMVRELKLIVKKYETDNDYAKWLNQNCRGDI